jgi:type I restriction enzyme S subunit
MPAHSVLFSSRAPIGYIAIAGQEMCTNQGFKSVVPNDNIDYMFLYYLLKYNKDKIEAMGSGTTFKEVSGSTMKEIEVTVPESLDEQKKIAAVLSVLDQKIEENEAINENLAA